MDTERWSAALWPFIRTHLPSAPATVLELGCGSAGGFVPALRESGYEAVGIDPKAPAAEGYERVGFEQYAPPQAVDAIVASRSLHHVTDLRDVIARMASALRPGGALIVAEWAWERFDDGTAEWCFASLDGAGAAPAEHAWLTRRRDGWRESGSTWEEYFRGWTAGHGLHRGDRILAEIDVHFEPSLCDHGPYFFADLDGISERDEQAAIERGEIRATGIRYTGTLRG